MREIVINSDFGGFGLSDEAIRRYFQLIGWKCVEEIKYDATFFYKDTISEETFFNEHDLERDDAFLVQIVKELGDKANGRYSFLKIVEIPEDVMWHICDYDGQEHVAEDHRTWY